jgi:hypothetical protein
LWAAQEWMRRAPSPDLSLEWDGIATKLPSACTAKARSIE